MSYPSACRTKPLPSAEHPASPATWPTWVTCPPSATPDTCCPLPRPFTLHSVTPTTPIARRCGLSLTERPLHTQSSSACRSHHIAINTKWPSNSRRRGEQTCCIMYSGWRGDFQLDLMAEGRIMPDLTDGMLQSRTLVDSEELMWQGGLWVPVWLRLAGMEWAETPVVLFAYFY